MNKNCVCTIASTNFLSRAMSTLLSMKKYKKDVDFYILNAPATGQKNVSGQLENIKVLDKNFIKEYELIDLNNNYHNDNTRWATKPFLIKKLLKKYDKVIYVEPDDYFVSDWNFLLEDIDGLLLTRHWRPASASYKNFSVNFTHGFFNAGFIGASKKSLDAINWWADCCYWKCEESPGIGLYVDQRYLDFIHLNFDNVKACKHKGCNLASWNDTELRKTFLGDKVIVTDVDNNVFESVFFHFSHLNGNPCVLKYYKEYIQLANKFSECERLIRPASIEDLMI